jgi:hypothetical protein
VPKWVRAWLLRDARLAKKVGRLFVRAIACWQRRAARARGIRGGKAAAVSMQQRFGGTLRPNVHWHLLVPDGLFVEKDGVLTFRSLPGPTDEEVLAIAEKIFERVQKLVLAKRDGEDHAEPDALEHDRVAVEKEAGSQARHPGGGTEVSRRCACVYGYSVHADVSAAAENRKGLEKLIAYMTRPPCPEERLTRLPDGRVLFRMKRPVERRQEGDHCHARGVDTTPGHFGPPASAPFDQLLRPVLVALQAA